MLYPTASFSIRGTDCRCFQKDNRVEQGFDNTVQDVENAPENVAGWFGEKVGDVERFDDNVDSAYDQGRYEGRNDYDY